LLPGRVVTSFADEGKVTCLVLLDLSAAFDTVDHDILLDVLRRRFLVEEPALKWFHSYLNDRTQVITVDGKESATRAVASHLLVGVLTTLLGVLDD